MKRVDLYMGKSTLAAANKRESPKTEAVEPWVIQAIEDVPTPDRQVRPRNELYQQVEDEAQFQGQPLSQAEVAHLVMAAKGKLDSYNLANHIV